MIAAEITFIIAWAITLLIPAFKHSGTDEA